MAEVLLFHHAQGLTAGVRAFADELRAAGHTVYTPDLFDGRTFQSIDEGLAYIGENGFDVMRERGVRLADELPTALVYAGFSFGVLPAQKLAQTRPGALGAVLCYSCLPISGKWAFGPWPKATPCRSTVWTTTRSSSARVTSMPREDCGESKGRGALPISRRPALLCRQLAPLVRRQCNRAAHPTRAGVPGPRLTRRPRRRPTSMGLQGKVYSKANCCRRPVVRTLV